MSATPASAAFAQTYAEARGKFLQAAAAAGLAVESHPHPLAGRDGEPLALDVVLDGAANATRMLVLSSACHGVEGFCGSGAQVALLQDSAWRAQARAAGVAVLHLHALNPYGFSWWRRATNENVDLNRNFMDFSQPLPRNTGYDDIAHLVVPPAWPPTPEVDAAAQAFVAERGAKAWQAAVSGGQYHHPQGLFFGGQAPTWSNRTLRAVLARHAQACTALAWIDFHTGLGPSGHGERIYAGPDEAAPLARTRAWWGEQVTSIYDGSSSSARLNGMLWLAIAAECPQAQYTGMALEYGTLPLQDVLNSMRAEQWLQGHPHTDAGTHQAIKQRMRDAFYVDTDEWKNAIVSQARDAAGQAVKGLAG